MTLADPPPSPTKKVQLVTSSYETFANDNTINNDHQNHDPQRVLDQLEDGEWTSLTSTAKISSEDDVPEVHSMYLGRKSSIQKTISFHSHNLPGSFDQHHGTASADPNSSFHDSASGHIPFKSDASSPNSPYLMIYPWSNLYNIWWTWTVFCAVVTIFFETYEMAFCDITLISTICETTLTTTFAIDILIKFRLAYYNERDQIVADPKLVARKYMQSPYFLMDLVSVIPWEALILTIINYWHHSPIITRCDAHYLHLLRLLRLLRVYRVADFVDQLAIDTRISLVYLTLIRNSCVALLWTHMAACILYFLHQQQQQMNPNGDDYGDATTTTTTFFGADVSGTHLTAFDKYVITLYWSMVTFSTVGFGDFVPTTTPEYLFSVFYILASIVIQAWIIGSITLLLMKKDEQTGVYRDTLETLDQYSKIHNLDTVFHDRLKTQLQLDFTTREIADEAVLRYFPASIRRKVLRRLYMPYLAHTDLMKGVRQQFVDEFLSTSRVEIFGPGEEILQRHAIASDLYLLVGGTVESEVASGAEQHSFTMLSSSDRTLSNSHSVTTVRAKAGDFINDIGFFTESPQLDTVRTVTVCKTLTMSRSSYALLSQDHPASAGKILQNLLAKVTAMEEAAIKKGQGGVAKVNLPQSMERLRVGSAFFEDGADMGGGESMLSAVHDLVKMHIGKLKDDHTTRFLFAASRDDVLTISTMCDQGFDPNSSDYDSRTALMVASMKGNRDAVAKLLEFHADPNLRDMHGSTALYEAARNGHEVVMDILLNHGARLNMEESHAASILDQAVFDGDVVLLKRLLKAQIPVNASDYDKRAAVHIAAAEGNMAALKTMVDFGADLSLQDRWGNTVKDEAERARSGQVLDYLKELQEQGSATV